MYGLSEEDHRIQARARDFADELIPFEEEAERSDGALPADVTAAHAKRARELGLHSRICPKRSAAAAAHHCSRRWSKSRWAGSPTRSAGWRPPRRRGCPRWPPPT